MTIFLRVALIFPEKIKNTSLHHALSMHFSKHMPPTGAWEVRGGGVAS
ncbi:hypothetical protein ACO0LE_09760 [Undibacterium sp. Xuan67W]